MAERSSEVTFSNGVKLMKWGRKEDPTAETVAEEMRRFGYTVYDLQTVAPWFERSRHAHDEPEIRGAVSGVIGSSTATTTMFATVRNRLNISNHSVD